MFERVNFESERAKSHLTMGIRVTNAYTSRMFNLSVRDVRARARAKMAAEPSAPIIAGERKELINWRYLPETACDPPPRHLVAFFPARPPARCPAVPHVHARARTRTRVSLARSRECVCVTHTDSPPSPPTASRVSIRILMRIDAHVSLP